MTFSKLAAILAFSFALAACGGGGSGGDDNGGDPPPPPPEETPKDTLEEDEADEPEDSEIAHLTDAPAPNYAGIEDELLPPRISVN